MNTFANLDLPYGYGHGVWTSTETIIGDDWSTAEDALVTAALGWIADHDGAAGAYHTFRNEPDKRLTLDLMRGG